MKIYKITHSMDAPSAYAVPDPDQFAREVLSELGSLKEDAVINPFQLADHERVGASFYRVSDSVLLFSEGVLESAIGSRLGFSGSVHPTTLLDSGEDVFFLNVRAIYNCLDVRNSVFYGLNGED